MLEDDNFKIVESSIIIQYMDEKFISGNTLTPSHAEDRARMRYFMDTFDKTLGSMIMKFIMASDDLASIDKLKKELVDHMINLNKFLDMYGSDTGPYFHGTLFSLAEVHSAPFIQRLEQVSRTMCNLDLLSECRNIRCIKLLNWIEAVLDRASVKSTMVPDEQLVKSYRIIQERLKKTN